MAILGMHSFDYGSSIEEVGLSFAGGGAHYLTTEQHRTGPQSLRLTCYGAFASPGRATWVLDKETAVWAQTAYFCPTAQDGDVSDTGRFGLFSFMENGSWHVQVGFDRYTSQLVATRNGTEIARSTQSGLFTPSTWIFVEVKVVIHDTNGSVLAKVNGIPHIDASGLDTRNGGSGVITHLGLSTGTTGYSLPAYFDDVMYGNGTGSPSSPPGDSRVEYLAPIAAGAKAQFTPSAGSNWGNVDETPRSDSDYNWSSEVGATDLFSMSNLSGNGTVHAVQTVIRARKDDAGFRLVKPALYKPIGQGNTVRLYTNAAPAASVGDTFAYSRSILPTSPDTASAWTVEEIADLQFGYAVGGGSQFSLDCWIEEF